MGRDGDSGPGPRRGLQTISLKATVRRSRADAIAYHKILANQPDGEYAVTNWEDCSIHRWADKPAR